MSSLRTNCWSEVTLLSLSNIDEDKAKNVRRRRLSGTMVMASEKGLQSVNRLAVGLNSAWEGGAAAAMSPAVASFSSSTTSGINTEVGGVSANCTPSSSYDYQDDRFMRHVVSIVVPVLFGVIVILGLIGNAFVIIIVLGKRGKQIRNSTNLLIVNLAVRPLHVHVQW